LKEKQPINLLKQNLIICRHLESLRVACPYINAIRFLATNVIFHWNPPVDYFWTQLRKNKDVNGKKADIHHSLTYTKYLSWKYEFENEIRQSASHMLKVHIRVLNKPGTLWRRPM